MMLHLSLSFRRLVYAVVLSAGLVSGSSTLAIAGERSNGQFFFDHAPRLVRTETSTIAATYMGGTTYEFTIAVPSNAGAPLQAITISQTANPRTVEFNPNQSRAIAVNGANIPLSSIGGAQGKETTIAFQQPIPPGETVTVLLNVDRNPDSAGAYLFGITAYPQGDQINGLFLGYGRVQLYSRGG